MRLRKDWNPVEQEFFQRRGIVQGTPQHAVKVGRNLLHEFDGQGRFADAPHAQQGHESALVPQQPPLKFCKLVRPPVQ